RFIQRGGGTRRSAAAGRRDLLASRWLATDRGAGAGGGVFPGTIGNVDRDVAAEADRGIGASAGWDGDLCAAGVGSVAAFRTGSSSLSITSRECLRGSTEK